MTGRISCINFKIFKKIRELVPVTSYAGTFKWMTGNANKNFRLDAPHLFVTCSIYTPICRYIWFEKNIIIPCFPQAIFSIRTWIQAVWCKPIECNWRRKHRLAMKREAKEYKLRHREVKFPKWGGEHKVVLDCCPTDTK